jgi:hypothetical protein
VSEVERNQLLIRVPGGRLLQRSSLGSSAYTAGDHRNVSIGGSSSFIIFFLRPFGFPLILVVPVDFEAEVEVELDVEYLFGILIAVCFVLEPAVAPLLPLVPVAAEVVLLVPAAAVVAVLLLVVLDSNISQLLTKLYAS